MKPQHDITITVSGPPKCGKTTLARYIARFLLDNGFAVGLVDDDDRPMPQGGARPGVIQDDARLFSIGDVLFKTETTKKVG